tara:strand:+ start:1268 stop:2392 length:1125 start_codon:yes stop_codon:yes gene_type:complete
MNSKLKKNDENLNWQTKQLGEICKITAGGDLDKNDFSLLPNTKYSYPIYSNGLKEHGLYGFCSMPRNEPNAVTITARGTIGFSAYRSTKFTPIGRLLVLYPESNIDSKFLSYFINGKLKFISETTGVPQLTAPQASKYLINFPKKINEQKAIAKVLSDVDLLINYLKKLIKKKTDIKRAVFETLFSQSRDFTKMIECKLGDVAKINMGQSPNSKFYNKIGNGLPLIQGNADLSNRKTMKRVFTSSYPKIADKGDIILTVRAPVGDVAEASEKICLGRGVCGLKSNYLILKFFFEYMEGRWDQFISGTTFDSINKTQLSQMDVIMPKNKDLDIYLYQFLEAQSEEILLVHEQLEKTKNFKKGMIQELLSGRKRLI